MATAVSNRPGAKAHARMVRMSASKVRVVLNLIRGKQVGEALEILQFSERLAAEVISKCLRSAIANAVHNEDLSEEDLFVSECFADEGPTLKRFRPRARGRAGRIHKQTCHITVGVSRLSDDELDQLRAIAELKNEGRQSRSKTKTDAAGDRAKRVAKSKSAADEETVATEPEVADATSSDNEPLGEAGAEVEETEAVETEVAEAEVEEAVEAEAEASTDEEPSDEVATETKEEEE